VNSIYTKPVNYTSEKRQTWYSKLYIIRPSMKNRLKSCDSNSFIRSLSSII